ncbi:MAG: RdgB/HAM1 family non-canonical purine NTP pyrophosphatase [Proteobacteria bacterium]|nr:RdgB/HAM1 family non-canonical purine NTP pyrophosphatase [Pseudomonadota bacterium]
MIDILVVTKNKGKLREILDIFGFKNINLKTLKDFPPIEIEESGNSFFENAYIKAKKAVEAFNVISMGEDSGLVVKVLDGKPGIFSRRFAGLNATDLENNVKLLELLKGVPLEQREAYFISSVVVMKPDGSYIKGEGKLEGYIIDEMRGTGGFGYDPIFFIPQYKKTLAELGDEVKNKISHRYRALMEIKRQIKDFLSL